MRVILAVIAGGVAIKHGMRAECARARAVCMQAVFKEMGYASWQGLSFAETKAKVNMSKTVICTVCP